MYASVVSAALLTGVAALGAAMPGSDTNTQREADVAVVACRAGSTYPAMEASARQACQATYTAYGVAAR